MKWKIIFCMVVFLSSCAQAPKKIDWLSEGLIAIKLRPLLTTGDEEVGFTMIGGLNYDVNKKRKRYLLFYTKFDDAMNEVEEGYFSNFLQTSRYQINKVGVGRYCITAYSYNFKWKISYKEPACFTVYPQKEDAVQYLGEFSPKEITGELLVQAKSKNQTTVYFKNHQRHSVKYKYETNQHVSIKREMDRLEAEEIKLFLAQKLLQRDISFNVSPVVYDNAYFQRSVYQYKPRLKFLFYNAVLPDDLMISCVGLDKIIEDKESLYQNHKISSPGKVALGLLSPFGLLYAAKVDKDVEAKISKRLEVIQMLLARKGCE